MTRIERIKERLFDLEYQTKKQWWGVDATILSDEEIKKEPLVVRKALAIEYTLKNMPAEIKPDELIVGIANMSTIGFGKVFPGYALEEEKASAAENSLAEGSVWGHHPVRYDKVLSIGLAGFKKEIYQKVLELASTAEPAQAKLDLYRAMLISLDAVQELASRYSDLALKAALQEQDPVRSKELAEIAEICSRVPQQPARTFHEALQSFWFVFIALHSSIEMVPTGRSDQYLYPYYKRDLESGRLTKDEARELLGSWLAKFSERVQLNPEHWEDHFNLLDYSDGGEAEDISTKFPMENEAEYNYGTSANHWLINMILGGVDRDGKDATNELTYMILETWSYLESVVPVMSVRFHKESPRELYELCARILRRGSGEPALYNDEVVIKGLQNTGIPLADARDYSNDGCWEVLIPGKSDFSYSHVEVLQLLEYVFTRGVSLVRGTKEGIDTGDPVSFETFKQFYGAFLEHVQGTIDHLLETKLKYYGERYKIAPSPLLSSMMDGCVESGLDLTNGGAHYRIYSLVITGLANCIDSLVAVKTQVFEERKVSMDKLVQAIRGNFEREEPLRQMLLNRAPKFGNEISYADEMACRLLADIRTIYNEIYNSKRDTRFIPMLAIGTFENYARFGHNVGASADGRLAQESISSNYSPALGMDRSGPTAVMKSIVSADLLPYCGGCPLDIQVNSNEVDGEAGIDRMVGLIKSFFDLGGVILTITGASEETLRDAQLHPERHRGLRVRLGGLSAYFIALPKKQQEIMITRVKHRV